MLKDGLPRSAFAYTPSAEPASWKLPYLTPEGAPDPDHLPGAAAALSAGGFRGQQVDLPAAALPVIKAKLRQAYKRWGKTPDEMPESIREAEFFAEQAIDALISPLSPLDLEDPELDFAVADMLRYREAGSDDHPYGAWAGGSAKSGGHMVGGGGGGGMDSKDMQMMGRSKMVDSGLVGKDWSDEDKIAFITKNEMPGAVKTGPEPIYPGSQIAGNPSDREGTLKGIDDAQKAGHIDAARARREKAKYLADQDAKTLQRQQDEFKYAVAGKKDSWVPGAGGSEMPFTSNGKRLQRVYNPKTREHGYLDLGSDIVTSDRELMALGRQYP